MLGQAGAQAYEYIYTTQAAVYTVVEFLATQISGVGLKVYERVSDTDREEVREGQLFDLLREPAPGLTYSMWMHQWVADRCVFGNAYMQKLGDGATKALIPLPAPRVSPRGGNLLSAGSYDFRSPTKTENIPAEQVVHSRRYNPTDPRIGVSPLEPLRVVLRSDAAALTHMENVWLNGARTGGWLKLPDELSEDAVNRLRASLTSAYSGSRNSGKVGILEGGADFKSDSWDPKESQFIEGRKLTLETVARAYNVPLSVLSLTENATYASAKEFHQQLYVDTLGPWFALIEEEIEAFIKPFVNADPKIQVRFNVEEKLRGSFEEQVVAYRNALGVPYLSVNEVRAFANKPRIDDPDYDLPVKPSNVVYGDAQAPGEAEMPAVRDEPGLRALPGGNP
jgi:HK97 family phage portal protein